MDNKRTLSCFLAVAMAAAGFSGCRKDVASSAVIKGRVLLPSNISPGYAANTTVALRSGEFVRISQTDGNGHYKFTDLPLGDYEVGSEWKNSYYECESGVRVQINRSTDEVKADFTLSCCAVPCYTGGGSWGSSCPYVYAFNGRDYAFRGDVFAGAIYPVLERSEYLPLPGILPVDGQYRFRVANELKELQYMDLAELVFVNHPAGTSVLFDRYGEVHTVSATVLPGIAEASSGVDQVAAVSARDDRPYWFTEANGSRGDWLSGIRQAFEPGDDFMGSLTLSFANDKKTSSGKLIVRAKNSSWSIHVYNQLLQLFGGYYSSWKEGQLNRTREQHEAWFVDQGVPLLVYVEKAGKWEYADCFEMPGPLLYKDMVMPLDLSGLGQGNIRIKLECAFGFWEVDYVAMDYTPDMPVSIRSVQPVSASGTDGRDHLDALLHDDDMFMAHTLTGDATDISFSAGAAPRNRHQTVFFHAKGYYERIVEHEGMPRLLSLLQAGCRGGVARYSKELYDRQWERTALANNTNHESGD